MNKLFKNNNKKITKILMSLKLTLGGLAASEAIAGYTNTALYIALGIGAIDIIVSGLSSEE